MSLFSTPKKTPNKTTTTKPAIQTPTHPSSRLKFRADGSLLPDPNPIKLTSPIPTATPRQQHPPPTPTSALSDTDLNDKLTTLLTRFFSPLNDEGVFLRTLGKLGLDMEIEVLGDVDGWGFLEGMEVSRERKIWLVEVYGLFDKVMRGVLTGRGSGY